MEQMAQTTEAQAEERVFTQEELEEILQKRLARERRNRPGTDGLQSREKELENRELLVEAKERLAGAGLPAALPQVLRYEGKAALERAIGLISGLDTARSVSWGQRPSGGRAAAQEDPIRRAMGLEQ